MWTRLTFFAGLYLSCASSLFAVSETEALQSGVERQAAEQYQKALRFRDIFRDVALKYGKTEEDVREALFPPTLEGLRTPERALRAASPAQALEAVAQHGKGSSALNLYYHGLRTPFGEPTAGDAIFDAKGPATLVIVPGMLQESLDDDMFAEITEVPTSFNQSYGARLEGVEDFAYDWGELAEKAVPLSAQLRIGSIDDKDGKPLIQLIVLRSAFGSFETVGPIERSSETYLRRLNKFLELLPPEAYQNLYLVGFSRGTMISLNMLAKIDREGSYPSLRRALRGIITLGGVVYGSELSDHPYRPFRPMLPEKTEAPDPLFLMEQTFKLVSVILKNSWDPISNLKRMAVLAREVNQAAEEIKTAARLDWWKNHVLPPEVPIYSINGSMPMQAMTLWPFRDAPFFGFGEPDYALLKIMAAKLQQVSGSYLNDGQITDAKGRLWAGLAERLNPRQKPLKVQPLGNVATHHYALGTRACIQQAGGKFNLFPRKIMLEALGAFVLEQQL